MLLCLTHETISSIFHLHIDHEHLISPDQDDADCPGVQPGVGLPSVRRPQRRREVSQDTEYSDRIPWIKFLPLKIQQYDQAL